MKKYIFLFVATILTVSSTAKTIHWLTFIDTTDKRVDAQGVDHGVGEMDKMWQTSKTSGTLRLHQRIVKKRCRIFQWSLTILLCFTISVMVGDQRGKTQTDSHIHKCFLPNILIIDLFHLLGCMIY